MLVHDNLSQSFYSRATNDSKMDDARIKPSKRSGFPRRRPEQKEKVLEILGKKNRLTSFEISSLLGTPLSKSILFELRKEGKVVQMKGYAKDGRIAHFYALRRNLGS